MGCQLFFCICEKIVKMNNYTLEYEPFFVILQDCIEKCDLV